MLLNHKSFQCEDTTIFILILFVFLFFVFSIANGTFTIVASFCPDCFINVYDHITLIITMNKLIRVNVVCIQREEKGFITKQRS